MRCGLCCAPSIARVKTQSLPEIPQTRSREQTRSKTASYFFSLVAMRSSITVAEAMVSSIKKGRAESFDIPGFGVGTAISFGHSASDDERARRRPYSSSSPEILARASSRSPLMGIRPIPSINSSSPVRYLATAEEDGGSKSHIEEVS